MSGQWSCLILDMPSRQYFSTENREPRGKETRASEQSFWSRSNRHDKFFADSMCFYFLFLLLIAIRAGVPPQDCAPAARFFFLPHHQFVIIHAACTFRDVSPSTQNKQRIFTHGHGMRIIFFCTASSFCSLVSPHRWKEPERRDAHSTRYKTFKWQKIICSIFSFSNTTNTAKVWCKACSNNDIVTRQKRKGYVRYHWFTLWFFLIVNFFISSDVADDPVFLSFLLFSYRCFHNNKNDWSVCAQ